MGTVLVERFELLSLLGVGAFGEVYRARDQQNPNTALAIKILRRPSAQALYRFKREFRALGEWSHPNLVALHELFLDAETAFFSMELVAGADFQSYVRPDGRLSKERLFSATQGLCDGVSALHERGRLHRDLKPANVLVEPSGRVVIVDLGLATLFGRGAAFGTEVGFIGTVQYAAPEQLAGAAVGPETDWYAVGVMLYEALSGGLPYDVPYAEQLSHKSRPPAPLAREGDDLDPLRQLCLALLQPDKKLRAGAAELRAALGGSTPQVVASEPPFVGRIEQLSVLAQLFHEVEQGASRVALVSASSGLGKTALVERFLRDLTGEHRATVLRGRCYVNEEVTYQAVDGNIDALSHHLCNLPRSQVAALLPRDVRSLSCLFPVLNRVDAIASAPPVRSLDDKASLRERAGVALRELTGRLSDRLPLVLFIDDIQWDDEDSAWLLSKLFQEPDPPAVMLICTCRTEVRTESHLLRSLETEPTTARLLREIPLPALSVEETVALTGHASEAVLQQPALADRIAAESGGHPMFALELARFAHDSAHRKGQSVRLSLDAALQERAAKLSEPARRLLETVCVAGRPLTYNVAQAAAACEVDALREVVSSKLVTISGTASHDTLSVYHDRIRESELAALPPARLRALHSRLADALAADQQRFDLIVEHYLAAGRRDAAARYALRAADHASAVLAFHRLPSLLLLAIEDSAPEGLSKLHLRLAESYALLGRRSDASQAYEKAAELEQDPEQRWELASLAMWQAFHAQELERGFKLLRELDAALGRPSLNVTPWRVVVYVVSVIWWSLFSPPKLSAVRPASVDPADEKRLRLLFRAYTSLFTTRGDLTVVFAAQAFRLSARLRDEAVYAATMAGFATALGLRSGRPSVYIDSLLERAQRIADGQPDLAVRRAVEACSVGYRSTCGADVYDRMWSVLDGEYPATPFGTFLRSLVTYTLGGSVLFWAGYIAQARQVGARAIALSRELSDPVVESGLRALTAYRLLADDDDETAWAEWFSTCQRYPEHAALRPITFGIVIALYQGRLDRAMLVLRKAWQLSPSWEAHFSPSRKMFLYWWGSLLALRIARGENTLGLRLRLTLAYTLIRFGPPPMIEPLALALGAARALLAGHEERGLSLLERAHDRFAGRGMRMFAACASHALARLVPDPVRSASYAAHANEVFALEKIRCPDKWLCALLPSFAEIIARRAGPTAP